MILVWALGCTPEGDSADPGTAPTLANVELRVFTPSCATAGCHDATEAGGLLLTAGSARTELIGVPATADPNLLRVVPAAPEASFLLTRLDATDGTGMPPEGPLPAELRDLVHTWVLTGAQD